MKASLTLGVLISAITAAVSSYASLLGQKSSLIRPDLAFLSFVSSLALLILVIDYSACRRPACTGNDVAAERDPAPLRRRWRIRLKSRRPRVFHRSRS